VDDAERLHDRYRRRRRRHRRPNRPQETDSNIGPARAKGIGDIGIVGAAAIANAVHHATGIRVRDLPIGMDRLISATQASTSRKKGDLQ
jgi:hypothetical protein